MWGLSAAPLLSSLACQPPCVQAPRRREEGVLSRCTPAPRHCPLEHTPLSSLLCVRRPVQGACVRVAREVDVILGEEAASWNVPVQLYTPVVLEPAYARSSLLISRQHAWVKELMSSDQAG